MHPRDRELGRALGDAAAELAKRGRAIVYDRRGFSRSERPEPFVTNVHQQTDDAAALIDALAAAPAIVIGRSHGGEIAVDLALRYPDRVRALALLEGGGLPLGEAFSALACGLSTSGSSPRPKPTRARVGETMLRAFWATPAGKRLPEPVRQVFTANGPAIVAEERGGLLDVERGATRHRSDSPTLLVGRRTPHRSSRR